MKDTQVQEEQWEREFYDKFDFIDCSALHGTEIVAFIKKVRQEGVEEGKAKMLEEIMDYKLNTFTAQTALFDGNVKLSNVSSKIVIDYKELVEALSKLKKV